MSKPLVLIIVTLAAAAATAAVPQLKGSPEAVGATGLKVKLLSGAKMMPSITPAGQRWTFTRGSEKWSETHYDVREIWSGHERNCQWKDRKGNTLTVATPSSFCPEFEKEHAKREDIEKKMSEDADAFKDPTDETLAKWASDFTQKNVAASALTPFASASVADARIVDFGGISRVGAFFKTKVGQWHYAEFSFAQESKGKERDSLIKAFVKGIQIGKSKGEDDDPKVGGYKFETDIASKSQAAAFVKMAGRFMSAMQAAYKRYVPPQKELGMSKIHVFSTEESYKEYMKAASAGEMGDRSIGLWDPNRDELSILYQGTDMAKKEETMKIMRHEAFHQYLHYATGRGDHAMWFNEGHACFFEIVNYDKKKNYVKVLDDPTDHRPRQVAEDPEKYANLVKTIIFYDHDKFYSGSLSKVNDNYTAAWAAIYFLQKGSHTFKEFAPYAEVLPAYMKAMAEGKKENEATKIAWELVSERDFAADFLKFWNKRKAARNYEPKEK
jgi:hypothetical protein